MCHVPGDCVATPVRIGMSPVAVGRIVVALRSYTAAKQLREHLAMQCLEDCISFLKSASMCTAVGILDATNTTIERRCKAEPSTLLSVSECRGSRASSRTYASYDVARVDACASVAQALFHWSLTASRRVLVQFFGVSASRLSDAH